MACVPVCTIVCEWGAGWNPFTVLLIKSAELKISNYGAEGFDRFEKRAHLSDFSLSYVCVELVNKISE